MSEALSAIFESIDRLFMSCTIDFDLLSEADICQEWFDDYNNQRVVNSFLFNYTKIQDKIGAKLFRQVLLALREVSDASVPMIDLLNLLEKLGLIESTEQWDRLREIRNAIAHEYPADVQERIDNILLALSGFESLRHIYVNIKSYMQSKMR